MVKLFDLLGGVALLPSLVSAYASPLACSGVCGNAHDPSILRRSDGTYFRFSTGGKAAIHSAPSITGPWVYRGAVLPSGSSIALAGNQDIWAPDVTLVGDQYYLYYSVSTFGSQDSAIGVARSSTMEPGSWVDLGSSGIRSTSAKPYNAIDGNLITANGVNYLTFGSWWNGIYQVQMSSPPTKVQTSSVQLAFDSAEAAMEGPTVFQHGSYYYLFFSKGICCGYDASRPATGKEYRIMVCRSSTPNGNFVDKNGKSCLSGGGTVVLESHDYVYGPGGQGVYQDPINGPILYYHYVDTRVGYADGQKLFGWNKISFSTGWPIV